MTKIDDFFFGQREQQSARCLPAADFAQSRQAQALLNLERRGVELIARVAALDDDQQLSE